MGKIWRQTEIQQRRVGEGRTTNRKWSFKNKPYPEKCQIVFHSSRNSCLGSQGRTQFGRIVKKTTSSLGKMWRAWCPDAGWSAVLFLRKSDLKYTKYRFLWLKIWNDKWLLRTRRKHTHCSGPLKSARSRAQSLLHQRFCRSSFCNLLHWTRGAMERSLFHAKVGYMPAGNYPYLHQEWNCFLEQRSHEAEKEEGESCL